MQWPSGFVLMIMLGGLAAGCTPNPLNSKRPLTPSDVEMRVRQVGAARAVNDLWEDHKWDEVTDGIAAGQPKWIRLVPELAPGVDAGPAEELRDNLGMALAVNPKAVLVVIDPKNGPATGADSVCSVAFGNNLQEDLPAEFVKRSIAAVEAVRAPGLASARDRCLASLRRGVCTVC